jgi:hypothetical protein
MLLLLLLQARHCLFSQLLRGYHNCAIEPGEQPTRSLASSNYRCYRVHAAILYVRPLVGRSCYYKLFTHSIFSCYRSIPYLAVYRFEETRDKPYNGAEDRVDRIFWQPFKNLTLGVGLFLALVFAWRLLVILLSNWGKDFDGRLKSLTISSNLRGEYRLKQAATRKLNTMMVNAHSLHQVDTAPDKSVRASIGDSSFAARTMLNYVLKGQQKEKIGGIVWTFGQVFSGRLFDTEGIWLPTRLIVFQGAQVIIAAFLGFAFIFITITAADMADEAQGTLDDYDMPQWAIDIVPTRQDVQIALYTSSGVAILAMFNIILIYIPR